MYRENLGGLEGPETLHCWGLKGGPRTGPLLLYGTTARVLEADRAGTDACCVTLKRFLLGARRVADAFTSISSLRSLNNLTT